MVGMHASMTLSDESLTKNLDLATKDSGAGYHFHLAEDKSDQNDAIKKYGRRATERFARFDLLNEKSLAIHGIHLDMAEIELLSKQEANLVICPRSNQNNSVGFASWWKYDGLKIGLGTDGIGSDIISEARCGDILVASRERRSQSSVRGSLKISCLEITPRYSKR